jgi:hypothetical protein
MYRIWGVWSAVAFFGLWFVGFVFLAGWLPPIKPTNDAVAVAEMFQNRTGLILAGMVLMIVGASFYVLWTVVLAEIIQDIEGRTSFLARTQLASGVVSSITFMLPAFAWATAAFRPMRNPEITQALVDFGWLLFITPIAPFIAQYLSLGAAIFADKRPRPAYPRWTGYLQIWVSLTFLPAFAAYFLKTGPLAWNGLFVWWIPFVMFTGWFAVMIVLTRRAVLATSAPAAAPQPSLI